MTSILGTPGRWTMRVQHCTSSVCPLLVLVSLLFTGHGLIRCLEKVVKLQKYCRKRWNLSKWITDKFYNRCQIIDNQGWRAWKRISIAAPITSFSMIHVTYYR